jgi:signal transduction histidine kinase
VDTSVTRSVSADLLGMAVLAALDETGSHAAEIAQRASGNGIELSVEGARNLLARLSELGMVRQSMMDGGEPRYVPTSLGQRIAAAELARPEGIVGLAELERLRTDLLATIVHELRTPLTSLRTCVGLLLDPTVTPSAEERQRLLSTIARASDRMQRLLGDVLDFARLRSGHLELQRRRFDARRLARDVATSMGPLAAAAEQTINMVLPDHAIWVTADRRRLEQALLNLVSNAQKFSPTGGEILLGLTDADGAARWTVTDAGPGIAADDQRRLFERFFVGEGGMHRAGTGLGLPTALAIAQAHGGTIEVTSELGKGSTFELVVPLLVEAPR